MQSQGQDGSRTIEINSSEHPIHSVFFAEEGKQVLSGGDEGIIRRWRVDDGHEVGGPIQIGGSEIYAAAMSPDRKWLVCGLRHPKFPPVGEPNLKVWDAKTHKKVLDIKGHTDAVFSVDISPDSTKLASGGYDKLAFIWNMTTGERLVGPLKHDGVVGAVLFSPTGDRIATATAENPDAKSIRIYNSDNGQPLLDIPFGVKMYSSSSLAWSLDGRQLFAASYSEVKRFDAVSGSLLSKLTIPGDGYSDSITLSHNQKFIVVATDQSLSFWDTSTQQQIGAAVGFTSKVWSVALSPNDDCIATGEKSGKVTLQSLHGILPGSYLTVNVTLQLPLMYINDAAFKSWMLADLTHAEELLTEEIVHPFHHARALAQRALVRSRLKRWDMAIDDAKNSIEIQRSIVGHIANAMGHVGNQDHESAMRMFDLVFSGGLATENNFLLLVKAIILFQCGKHDDAISRVGDLINIVDDKSLHITVITVRAQMSLILAGVWLSQGDGERAMKSLMLAREAIPFQNDPHLVVISLIFGWDFDRLALELQLRLQECIKIFEDNGDSAIQSKNPKEAIARYSMALSLSPSNPAGLFVKRSKARAMLGLWSDALKDVDEAIKEDPTSPWGYERRHAALHALQRYDEAVTAFTCMISLMEGSFDPDTRQLAKNYVLPSRSNATIESVVLGVFRICPLVLIDVKSGRLCDGHERMHTFKSESQYKELVSSMTQELDNERIQQVVEEYFLYVTFSHVWAGREPSFQDVKLANSVWDLDSSPLDEKLRKFCEVVRNDGYRWAWSDTCCIDKTISTVLNQSLTMMYKWYEASAATFVLLSSVDSPSALGDLTKSIWMTRAWTAQELLSGMVIRFYDRNWIPYLGDARPNHKKSPEIMQELANAIGVARETIIAFNPDYLTVREKLRLASSRRATVEEDIAYSLIGIFKSDIRPHYGEGDAALGHLMEEIVARSGEVTVLAWTGKSSPYNSCLPATLAVYGQTLHPFPAIQDAGMDARIAALRNSLPQVDAMLIHDRVTRLPPARFANRRLYLPCIIFGVKKLVVQDLGNGQETHYRARVSGIGSMEFQTSDRLSLKEPRKLILVHPWIRDLCDPPDGFTRDSDSDSDESDSDPGASPCTPLRVVRVAKMDDYTRALRLVARLRQPFHALLLQQQPNGEFKRVASEHEIIVPGDKHKIDHTKDIQVGVVEVL